MLKDNVKFTKSVDHGQFIKFNSSPLHLARVTSDLEEEALYTFLIYASFETDDNCLDRVQHG